MLFLPRHSPFHRFVLKIIKIMKRTVRHSSRPSRSIYKIRKDINTNVLHALKNESFFLQIGAVSFVQCSSLTLRGVKRVFDESLLAAIGRTPIEPERKPCCCICWYDSFKSNFYFSSSQMMVFNKCGLKFIMLDSMNVLSFFLVTEKLNRCFE